jgi:hypothetical protein
MHASAALVVAVRRSQHRLVLAGRHQLVKSGGAAVLMEHGLTHPAATIPFPDFIHNLK